MSADVVVIGAGVFGAWTAHHLALRGARVTLVDGYGPAHARASSGDESRIIRCGYGPDEIYSRWADRSLAMWKEWIERDCSAESLALFHPSGVLWLAPAGDLYLRATRNTLQRLVHPIEMLDADRLRRRFPQIEASDIPEVLLESDCGVLMARRAVQTLVASLERRGVRLLHAQVTPVPSALQPCSARSIRLTSVQTTDGEALQAAAFVFACGPWLPKVLPDLLSERIRPTRQEVVYFGAPAGGDFGPARLPAWVDFSAGVYGVPDIEGRGVKVGVDAHGPAFDPDSEDRIVSPQTVASARAWLARRMPALADAPVTESRVCQYENTSTGDFLIDRHSFAENVWIVGGGSGHGFKHGPMVGQYAASLVDGSGLPEPRFALATKGTAPARAIY